MRRAGLALLLAGAAGAGCAGPAASPAPVVRGPVPTRTQHPLQLTQLAFLPRRAATQPRGTGRLRVASAYSNTYEVEDEDAPAEAVFVDGEIWRTALGVRWGLGDATDLEVQVPLVYTTSGFLDGVADAFHETFFLPDAGRSTAPDDQWRVHLDKNGERVWEMEEDRLGLGDVPVVLTQALLDEDADGFGLALSAGAELPTGSESKGFGNGALDWGGGFVAERSSGRWTVTGGAHWVRTHAPSDLARAGVELENLVDVQLGGEMRWSDRTSLLVGLVWTTPMTKDFAAEEISSSILDLGVGAAWSLSPRSRLSATFHEDLVSKTGPDFAGFVVWTLDL